MLPGKCLVTLPLTLLLVNQGYNMWQSTPIGNPHRVLRVWVCYHHNGEWNFKPVPSSVDSVVLIGAQ